jgi:hypothetical protein
MNIYETFMHLKQILEKRIQFTAFCSVADRTAFGPVRFRPSSHDLRTVADGPVRFRLSL